MRVLLVLLAALLAAACDTAIPSPPPITVVITAVDDTAALADGVAQALTGTAQVQIGLTETVLALGGITLTPSSTPTPSPTPAVVPTRQVSPTATFTPSVTPTPTFVPFATSLPALAAADAPGRLRVLHGWRGDEAQPAPAFDVYINGQRVKRGLTSAQASNYQQVPPGAVQVALFNSATNVDIGTRAAPELATVVEVPPGGSVSLLLLEPGALIPIVENAQPVPSGRARLTIVQANPLLLPANVLLPDIQRALVYNLRLNDIVGPLDVPAGSHLVDLYDAEKPEQLITSLRANLTLANRLEYVLVLLPSPIVGITEHLLFSGAPRGLPTDTFIRFVNAAPQAGEFALLLDDQTQFDLLPVGMTEAIPVSTLGVRVTALARNGRRLMDVPLGPWDTPAVQRASKIVLLTGDAQSLNAATFVQSPPRSAINASLRLIHGLQDVIPLNLEIRPALVAPPTADAPTAPGAPTLPPEALWQPAAQASFGLASDYVTRAPGLYDVRLLLSGTRNVIAQINQVELAAGGTYDFVAFPGAEPGSAQMALVEPDVQVSNLGAPSDPDAIAEAVRATLTAAAPRITSTPTRAFTPTPTWTPVLTNTPRPTNTPSLPPPSLLVDPAPPNTLRDQVTVIGQGFAAGAQFVVRLDDNPAVLFTGRTLDDGTLAALVNLPATVSAGPHVLRVCADCRPGGQQQEAFAVINVAPPDLTPTATRQP